MIQRTYFVPQHWEVRQGDIVWAVKEFSVTPGEIYRQISLLRDHEFKRPYSDWNRVFRNWMRKAQEVGTLRVEHSLRLVDDEPMSEEERKAEADRAWADMEKKAGRKLR